MVGKLDWGYSQGFVLLGSCSGFWGRMTATGWLGRGLEETTSKVATRRAASQLSPCVVLRRVWLASLLDQVILLNTCEAVIVSLVTSPWDAGTLSRLSLHEVVTLSKFSILLLFTTHTKM